jgi:hypothetical protein
VKANWPRLACGECPAGGHRHAGRRQRIDRGLFVGCESDDRRGRPEHRASGRANRVYSRRQHALRLWSNHDHGIGVLRRRDERYDLTAARHNDPPCCGRQVDRQRLIDEGGDIEAAVAYRVGDKRAKHRPPLTGQRADIVARMKHEFTVGPGKPS